jgi:hypothetical protein
MNVADALNLSDIQRTILAELIVAEQRHASRWWTHLNELRRRNELPDWVKGQDVGSYQDHDLWCESRKALNQALFGSDDAGGDRHWQEVTV